MNPYHTARLRSAGSGFEPWRLAADELHTSRFVSHATWNTLAQRYSESPLREVVLIVGNYTQLAMFQNTLGAQLEPGYDGLPDEAR